MPAKTVDKNEWEYLKSCGDKIRRIVEVLNEKEKEENETSADEKLKEIKKILKEQQN